LLQLIDQSNIERMLYRCSECDAEGVSTTARGHDGFFWVPAKTPGPVPGRWVEHVCKPEDIDRAAVRREKAAAEAKAAAVPSKPARRKREVVVAAPEVVVPKKRGRPKKQVEPQGA
jgi:hypothetical protein